MQVIHDFAEAMELFRKHPAITVISDDRFPDTVMVMRPFDMDDETLANFLGVFVLDLLDKE